MNIDNFRPVYEVGVLEYEEDSFCPAVGPVKHGLDIEMNPEIVAGFLTALFECMIDMIPDSEQIEFEKKSLKLFNRMVKIREEHTEKIDIS